MSPSKRDRSRHSASDSQKAAHVAQLDSFPIAVTAPDILAGSCNEQVTKWYKIGNCSSANGRLTFQPVTPVFESVYGPKAQLLECVQVDDLFLTSEEKGSIASYVGLLSTGQQVLIRLAAVYAHPMKQADGSLQWIAQKRSHCHLGSCNGAVTPATTKAAYMLPDQVLIPQLRDSQKAKKERGQHKPAACGRKRAALQDPADLAGGDRRLHIRLCLNEVSSHLGPALEQPLFSRLLVTVHPLNTDMRAAPDVAPGTCTKWASSTEPGQGCSSIRYLPHHLEACTRDGSAREALAEPIGYGLSGPIRVAANNDGAGQTKPPPLPAIHIPLSQSWLASAPSCNALAVRDAWWRGASTCRTFIKLPLIPYWNADAKRAPAKAAATTGRKMDAHAGRKMDARKRARYESDSASELSDASDGGWASPDDSIDDDAPASAGRHLHHARCNSPAVCSPHHAELGGPGQQQLRSKRQRFSHDRQQSPLPKWVRSAPRAISIRVDCDPESLLIDSASTRSSSVPGGPSAAVLSSPAWPITVPFARGQGQGSLPTGSGSAPGSKPGGAATLQHQAQLDQVSKILFPEAQEGLADWIPDFLDDAGLECCVPDFELLPEHLAVSPAQGSNFRCLGRSDPDTTLEAPPCTGLQAPSVMMATPLPMPTATGSDSLAAQGWLFDLQMPVFPEQLLNAEQAVC